MREWAPVSEGSPEHLDVLIVGAGLSGIGAAYHLQERCPGKSYAILEARERPRRHLGPVPLPGHPLGLGHVHARLPLPAVDRGRRRSPTAPSILDYIRETAREYGDRRARSASTTASSRAAWSTRRRALDGRGRARRHRRDGAPDLRLPARRAAATTATTRATRPSSPGASASPGRVVHPQHWPEDLDYAGKRVVVIGSGATAVTLVPAMAETAAHVTMLQRSPTYIVSLPAEDRDRRPRCAASCPSGPPTRSCAGRTCCCRRRFYQLSRRRPELVKRLHPQGRRARAAGRLRRRHALQRRATTRGTSACAWCPTATSSGRSATGSASVVTDQIETLHRERASSSTPASELEADVIVTATGLNLLFARRHASSRVDGERGRPARDDGLQGHDAERRARTSPSPIGYTNASWTLKADLTSEYVCRLLNHMDAHGYRAVRAARSPTRRSTEQPLLDFTSGYVQRSLDQFPKQGSKEPWRLRQNYVARHPHDPPRRDRRRRDAVLPRRRRQTRPAGPGRRADAMTELTDKQAELCEQQRDRLLGPAGVLHQLHAEAQPRGAPTPRG